MPGPSSGSRFHTFILDNTDGLTKIHPDLLYVTASGTNVLLSPLCRMFVQECDITGGDIKEVNECNFLTGDKELGFENMHIFHVLTFVPVHAVLQIQLSV